MHSVFKATELLTSNLIYSHIMQSLEDQLDWDQALLLTNTTINNEELVVVDARGSLPGSMDLKGLKLLLDAQPKIAGNLLLKHELGRNYHNLIKFQSNSDNTYSYLLFSGPTIQNDPELNQIIQQITYLLEVKTSFDSLPLLKSSQSRLQYQLNFFSSMINNIFEPYSSEMLINLYMEIVSEMFLFPEALTLQLDENVFRPAYAKGTALDKYSGLLLEAAPILKNRYFRFFPTVMEECAPDSIGTENYRILRESGARILVPLCTGEQLDYIIICISPLTNHFQDYDKASLVSLSNILNRNMEMQHVKSNLIQSNHELDAKLYALTSLYRAAEVIFSSTGVNETLQIILDMIMENYQSAISSVFLHNSHEDRFDLMAVKSAFHNEDLAYSFKSPDVTAVTRQIIIDYRGNMDERKAFLEAFPDFIKLEEQLNPCLIAQILKGDEYYGFITLSDRVTGQDYSQNDRDLLYLLLNSISLAIQNVRIFDQLEVKSQALEQSLLNIYAIQDVLLLIKQARNLDHFLTLLNAALEMGAEVKEMSVFAWRNQKLEVLIGNHLLSDADLLTIQSQQSPALTSISIKGELERCLVLPIYHEQHLKGCLLIESFHDTVIEDGEKIQLLSIIANIIGEAFAGLLEKQVIYADNIIDFSKLILFKLQEQVDYLQSLGLEATIVKFHAPSPQAVIVYCQEWAEGFVIDPQTGILISNLSADEIAAQLQPHNLNYRFIEMLNMESIYSA